LMLRDVNQNYLSPLQPVYPSMRLGSQGDAPKAQCVTCHNGVYKPLYGAQMVKDYPALWGRPDWNGVPFKGVGTMVVDTASKAPAGIVTTVKKSAALPAASTTGVPVGGSASGTR
ncbi:photosynthetic reaction center cytochrome c subunit family protein, partial [Gemmatimonas sp.]